MVDTFNTTAYGPGFEGFINWTNALSGNWMMSIFIIVISMVGFIVSRKNGMSTYLALILSGLMIIVLTPIIQLFTIVNSQIVIIGLVMIAIGVGGRILEKR